MTDNRPTTRDEATFAALKAAVCQTTEHYLLYKKTHFNQPCPGCGLPFHFTFTIPTAEQKADGQKSERIGADWFTPKEDTT